MVNAQASCFRHQVRRLVRRKVSETVRNLSSPRSPQQALLTQGTKEARIEGAWGVDKGKKDGRADVSRRAQRTVVSSVRLGAGFKALL